MRFMLIRGGKKLYNALTVCLVLSVLLIFVGSAAAVPTTGDTNVPSEKPVFADLSTDSPLYPYVRYLTDKGIIKGFPDGTFRPAEAVTRAEAARVMVLAKGLQPVKDGPPTFSDVFPDYWAYGEIEAATKAGLFKGYPDGSFSPDSTISRAEAITLLLNLSGGALSGKTVAIGDVGPDHWAYRQVVTAVEAGLVELSANKLFEPDQAFRRSDLARGLSVMFTLSPVLRPADLTGMLTVKKGQATVTGKGGISSAVTGETTVGFGDKIVTGDACQAEISFDDGSGFLIEAGAELEIVKAQGFNYMRKNGSPGVAVDKLEVKLTKGRIFGSLANRYENTAQPAGGNKTASLGGIEGTDVILASTELPPGLAGILLAQNEAGESGNQEVQWWAEPYTERERVTVDMPWGVAGIRGTFWTNLVDALGQSTALITGHATVTANGQTVSLSNQQSTTITSSGAIPAPPAGLSEADRQAWTTVATWVTERAQAIQNNLPPPPAPVIVPVEVVEQIQQLEQIQEVNVVDVVSQALTQATSGTTTNVSNHGSSGDHTAPTVDLSKFSIIEKNNGIPDQLVGVAGAVSEANAYVKAYRWIDSNENGVIDTAELAAAITLGTSGSDGSIAQANIGDLAAGTYKFVITATDAAGNESPKDANAVKIFILTLSDDPSAPTLTATAAPGSAGGTTMLAATPGAGNHLAVKVSSSSIAIPNVGDSVPTGTGVTNPYSSGADVSGVDATFNKYVGIYEANDDRIVAFHLITLTSDEISALNKTVTIYNLFGGAIQATVAAAGRTYVVTTANIADGKAATITWYGDVNKTANGNTAPTGIAIAPGGAVATNAVTLNITVNELAPTVAGDYFFTVTIDGVESEVKTMTVTAAPPASPGGDSVTGWTFTGLWNVINNNSGIKNEAVDKFVYLPEGDNSSGFLPNAPLGNYSFWYGRNSSENQYTVGNYLNNQVQGDQDLSGGQSMTGHSGSLTSPVFLVPPGGSGKASVLSFTSWWEIESINPDHFDQMRVYIIKDDVPEILAVLNPITYSTGESYQPYTSGGLNQPAVWINYTYDLSIYQNKSVRIRFDFDTGDGFYNAFRGWFVNNVDVHVVDDNTPPSSPTINTVTSNDTILAGTAEPGSTVTIKAGAITIGTAVTAGNGTFTVTIPAQVIGTILSATATDAAGNVSVATMITVTAMQVAGSAIDSTVSMADGNILITSTNNSWILDITEGTVATGVSVTDLNIVGLPGGLNVAAQKGNTNTIDITVAGFAYSPVTTQQTISITVKGSSVTQVGAIDSAPIYVSLDPVGIVPLAVTPTDATVTMATYNTNIGTDNKWTLAVTNATVKDTVNENDLEITGLPDGLLAYAQKGIGNAIDITVSGSVAPPVNASQTVSVVVYGSAISEAGTLGSLASFVYLNPAGPNPPSVESATYDENNYIFNWLVSTSNNVTRQEIYILPDAIPLNLTMHNAIYTINNNLTTSCTLPLSLDSADNSIISGTYMIYVVAVDSLGYKTNSIGVPFSIGL